MIPLRALACFSGMQTPASASTSVTANTATATGTGTGTAASVDGSAASGEDGDADDDEDEDVHNLIERTVEGATEKVNEGTASARAPSPCPVTIRVLSIPSVCLAYHPCA